jgi:hypothetical protein
MDLIRTNYQEYISTTPSNDIIWDTVSDQPTIEQYLLSYNRKSFRAAASSPLGHGIIYDSLSFTSLSPSADKFLAGQIPQEWYNNDSILKEFMHVVHDTAAHPRTPKHKINIVIRGHSTRDKKVERINCYFSHWQTLGTL